MSTTDFDRYSHLPGYNPPYVRYLHLHSFWNSAVIVSHLPYCTPRASPGNQCHCLPMLFMIIALFTSKFECLIFQVTSSFMHDCCQGLEEIVFKAGICCRKLEKRLSSTSFSFRLTMAAWYRHEWTLIYDAYNFPSQTCTYRQLRARRALLQLKDVPLRTRRALLLFKVNGISALLVLNGTSLICNSALLVLSWRYIPFFNCMIKTMGWGSGWWGSK